MIDSVSHTMGPILCTLMFSLSILSLIARHMVHRLLFSVSIVFLIVCYLVCLIVSRLIKTHHWEPIGRRKRLSQCSNKWKQSSLFLSYHQLYNQAFGSIPWPFLSIPSLFFGSTVISKILIPLSLSMICKMGMTKQQLLIVKWKNSQKISPTYPCPQKTPVFYIQRSIT